MGMNNSMPQHQASHAHSDTESKQKSKHESKHRHANQPQARSVENKMQESKTTESDSRCDFPKINSIAPLRDVTVTTGNLQCKTQHRDAKKIKKLNSGNSRRYSDLFVCESPGISRRPMTAQRRSSTPNFRALSLSNNNVDVHGNNEPKLPENTPCCPDLMTCSQNVATFLANAAAATNSNSAPNAEYIYSYIRFLFAILQLEPECCVYADIYLRRLLSNAQGTIRVHSGNWHKILVGACLLASKYVDDLSMDNRDFSAALTGCTLKFMNKLESKFLQLLKWQLHVPISEYTTRYFELASKKDIVCDWDVNIELVKPHFTVIIA